jgi:hypothetical protein
MTAFPSYPRLCPYEAASEELVAHLVRQAVGRVRVVDIQWMTVRAAASVPSFRPPIGGEGGRRTA